MAPMHEMLNPALMLYRIRGKLGQQQHNYALCIASVLGDCMQIRRLASCSALAVTGFLAGCTIELNSTTGSAPATGISGRVHGGQQPVSGATIQLYPVGISGDGSSAQGLLNRAVTTDANGDFSITSLYSCAGSTEVYLTATGGDPGVGAANPNLALMTAIGPCSSLNASTFIFVNELTTVGAVEALAPYMSASGAVGSAPSDSGALATAFTLASSYVNPFTGSSPGLNVPAGYTVPTATSTRSPTSSPVVSTQPAGPSAMAPLAATSSPPRLLPAVASRPPTPSLLCSILPKIPTSTPSASTTLSSRTLPSSHPFPAVPTGFGIQLIPASGLQLSTTAIAFNAATIFIGLATQGVTITNGSVSAVNLNSLSFSGINAADFTTSSVCPAILQPSATCTVQVNFIPQGPGARSGFLQIASTTPATLQLVSLTGTGSPNSESPANIFMTGQAGTYPSASGQILTFPGSSAGSGLPSQVYTAAPQTFFYGLKGDASGNLYTNTLNSVQVFQTLPSGAVTPSRSVGFSNSYVPLDVAADSSGRILLAYFNANNNADDIDVYPAAAYGSTAPAFTLANFGGLVAVDSSNNLFTLDSLGNIAEFSNGFTATSATARTIDLSAAYGTCPSAGANGLATDLAGNVYVLLVGGTNCQNEILEYPPSANGTASPARVIAGPATLMNQPNSGLAVDANRTIYVPDTLYAGGAAVVLEWSPSASGNVAPNTLFLNPNTNVPGAIVVR